MADDHLPVYQALLDAQKDGTPACLVTITATTGSMPRHVGSKMLVYGDGRIVGTIGGGAMEAKVIADALASLADGRARTPNYHLNNLEDGDPGICGGSATFFIEPLAITPTLLIVGGGHVGKALAQLGKWMGFRVALSDDRPDYVTPAHVPDLDQYILCPPATITEHITITDTTYIAAVTRGLPVDRQLIPMLLTTPAPYIGLIGSRRRWAITIKALREEHALTDEQIKRVHAPIGLEIQAESPHEIAVSIMAEIIMTRRGGTGEPMRWYGTVEQA